MHQLLQAIVNSDERTSLRDLLDKFSTSGEKIFLRNDILQAFAQDCQQSQKPAYFYHSSSLGKFIHHVHEILLAENMVVLQKQEQQVVG